MDEYAKEFYNYKQEEEKDDDFEKISHRSFKIRNMNHILLLLVKIFTFCFSVSCKR